MVIYDWNTLFLSAEDNLKGRDTLAQDDWDNQKKMHQEVTKTIFKYLKDRYTKVWGDLFFVMIDGLVKIHGVFGEQV